jgi:hypothetical protein
MRYKGGFGPSDLLCPRNKCWVPMATCAAALDQVRRLLADASAAALLSLLLMVCTVAQPGVSGC